MKRIFIFILFSLVLNETAFAENRDSTLAVMKRNIHFITNAAEQFHINPIYLSAIIYTERHQNYSWQDRVFDIDLYKKLGKNSSIGFCQIKIKTAYFIDYCYNTDNYLYFPGKQYEKMLVQSDNPDDLITRLVDDSTNICYAAAYLRVIAGRWESAGFPIDDRPDILGTLYSTGLFYKDGSERKPHAVPCANAFGKDVDSITDFIKNELFDQ